MFFQSFATGVYVYTTLVLLETAAFALSYTQSLYCKRVAFEKQIQACLTLVRHDGGSDAYPLGRAVR